MTWVPDENSFWTLYHFKIEEGVDETDFDEEEIGMKVLGYYSSEAMAKMAINRLKIEARFRDYPGGFRIYGGGLDHDVWRSGFIEYP